MKAQISQIHFKKAHWNTFGGGSVKPNPLKKAHGIKGGFSQQNECCLIGGSGSRPAASRRRPSIGDG